MNNLPKKSIYPEPTKGALSDNHESYIHPVIARGPKKGDTQTKLILFGVLFFVVFTVIFAFSFGLGRYFAP